MPRRRPRRRLRRRIRTEEAPPNYIFQLQYLANIMACCYLQRQYRKGGHGEDLGFLFIGFGAALLGAFGISGCIGSLYLDIEDWYMSRRAPPIEEYDMVIYSVLKTSGNARAARTWL